MAVKCSRPNLDDIRDEHAVLILTFLWYTLLEKQWSVAGIPRYVLVQHKTVPDITLKSEKHELMGAVSRTISYSIS